MEQGINDENVTFTLSTGHDHELTCVTNALIVSIIKLN